MAKKIGVLVDIDFCVGCSACQLACQDYYHKPVEETYMRMFLGKPDFVDGKPEMFMTPYPYRLDKCAECIEKEGAAPCAKICIAKALHIGEVAEMEKLANAVEWRTALYR